MTDHKDRAALEAWIDGDLNEAEKSAFVERLAQDEDLALELECESRLENALRRKFQPPSSVRIAALDPVSPLPSIERTRQEHGSSMATRAFWAAVAAVLVAAFFVLDRGSKNLEPTSTDRLAHQTESDREWEIPAAGMLGVSWLAPDIDDLYAEVAASATSFASCEGAVEIASVESTLLARYGGDLRLSEEAGGLLRGPYHSSKWPTGTVLVGYPEGSKRRPAVLIAEEHAHYMCCVDPVERGDLRVFVDRVGETLLTEITPYEEPGLLPYFSP